MKDPESSKASSSSSSSSAVVPKVTNPPHSKEAAQDAKKARKEARRALRRQVASQSAEVASSLGLPASAVNLEASLSNAHRPLPAPPAHVRADDCTICLFYQYKEPAWKTKEHKAALNKVTELATHYHITGRGRCAPEGLNCTLTASPNDMRAFCYALRSWDPATFDETDFKLQDEVPGLHKFRTFTLRKVNELVGYGLEHVKAPSLQRHSGTHLEAPAYHQQMQQKDTVIIDVRNKYESDIGHFQPPPDGATLLDPQMRTSQDFPKWLNAPETKEKLQNKTVMMYCTGGIRCERATALLNQMTEAADDNFQTKDVVMVRGGIERYLKTFPQGGFWKGKNYLFDKRMEQVPSQQQNNHKSTKADNHENENDDHVVKSFCCVCHTPHSQYRGQHKCAQILPSSSLPCAVPVLVCDACQNTATQDPHSLECPLCKKGYQTPDTAPDLVGQKRKLGVIAKGGTDLVTGQKWNSHIHKDKDLPSTTRLFCGKLPLTVTASSLRQVFRTLLDVKMDTIQWIVDHDTRAFYGSAFCQMASVEDAQKVMEATSASGAIQVPWTKKKSKSNKRIRVAYAPPREKETWPPLSYRETEYPPLGT